MSHLHSQKDKFIIKKNILYSHLQINMRQIYNNCTCPKIHHISVIFITVRVPDYIHDCTCVWLTTSKTVPVYKRNVFYIHHYTWWARNNMHYSNYPFFFYNISYIRDSDTLLTCFYNTYMYYLHVHLIMPKYKYKFTTFTENSHC